VVWLPFPPFRRNPKASAARQRSSNHVLWVMLQVLARLCDRCYEETDGAKA